MCQCVVILLDKLSKLLGAFIADLIPPEVQATDHFSVSQETAQLVDVRIGKLLLLNEDHVRLENPPALER